MKWTARTLILAGLAIPAGAGDSPTAALRAVAVTFDDLPGPPAKAYAALAR